MKCHFVLFGLVLALLGVCAGQSVEAISPIKDAPFSAEIHHRYANGEDLSESMEYVARSGNGSVYFAKVAQFGNFKGSISEITVDDAPSKCRIRIRPFLSKVQRAESGRITGGMAEGGDVILELRQNVRPDLNSVDAVRESWRRTQPCRVDGAGSGGSHGEFRSLGERNVDGMILFGFHTENASDSPAHHVEDYWESDLGFTYSRTNTDFSGPTPKVSTLYVEKLKRGDPAPELFTVQDKYLRPTSAFSKSNTVFISNSVGDLELQRRIESILTASGRFTIVRNSRKADLSVALRIDRQRDDRQAILTISKSPGTRPDLEITRVWLIFPKKDAPDQWAESPLVNTCFANVWAQLENVKAPTTPSDSPFLRDLQ